MSEVGWLFDVYLEDGDAILWIKCESGNVLKLKDRYIPSFYVESENPLDHKVLKQVLPAHPNIQRRSLPQSV